MLVKDEDDYVEHSNVVNCPVLRVMNILNDSLLPEPSAVDWRSPTPSNYCYIIYASGTTGKPKGVVWEFKRFFFHSTWGITCVQESRSREPVLSL